VVLLAAHEGPLARAATHVLPACTWAEAEGTFVNAKGMAQAFRRALAPAGDARPGWELAARLGRAMQLDLAYERLSEVRAALAARGPAGAATGAGSTGA
jgi:NADH-quinone oxidoreductase subunit G